VKCSHHAQFDKAWYLQATHPPASQFLYNLGVEPGGSLYSETGILVPLADLDFCLPGTTEKVHVPWPSLAALSPLKGSWRVLDRCTILPLPLRHMATEPEFWNTIMAKAARAQLSPGQPRQPRRPRVVDIMTEYDFGRNDMAMVYMSPDPYFDAFQQPLNLRKFDYTKHPTAGLSLYDKSGRLYLATMSPSTPVAKIPDWRTQVQGAWLIKIGTSNITSIEEAHAAFMALGDPGATSTVLLFAHSEIQPILSHNSLPIISSAPFTLATHNRLNNCWEFSMVADYLRASTPTHTVVESDDVLNVVNCVMKLTRGKLLKQSNWNNWQELDYLQLNQYYEQGMFGQPQMVDKDAAIFDLVWMYNIKALDGRKKARCVCNRSPRASQARILDKTYTNCVNQMSSRMFYAIAAAENLLIYGAGALNTFAEATPPKQGFYIYPDHAFNEWWVNHKHQPLLATGQVIPILSAMQGHPESPHLWEKHANLILRDLGLTPMVHEPCLYSRMVKGKQVILKRQVLMNVPLISFWTKSMTSSLSL
jgi:hypothetical protein